MTSLAKLRSMVSMKRRAETTPSIPQDLKPEPPQQVSPAPAPPPAQPKAVGIDNSGAVVGPALAKVIHHALRQYPATPPDKVPATYYAMQTHLSKLNDPTKHPATTSRILHDFAGFLSEYIFIAAPWGEDAFNAHSEEYTAIFAKLASIILDRLVVAEKVNPGVKEVLTKQAGLPTVLHGILCSLGTGGDMQAALGAAGMVSPAPSYGPATAEGRSSAPVIPNPGVADQNLLIRRQTAEINGLQHKSRNDDKIILALRQKEEALISELAQIQKYKDSQEAALLEAGTKFQDISQQLDASRRLVHEHEKRLGEVLHKSQTAEATSVRLENEKQALQKQLECQAAILHIREEELSETHRKLLRAKIDSGPIPSGVWAHLGFTAGRMQAYSDQKHWPQTLNTLLANFMKGAIAGSRRESDFERNAKYLEEELASNPIAFDGLTGEHLQLLHEGNYPYFCDKDPEVHETEDESPPLSVIAEEDFPSHGQGKFLRDSMRGDDDDAFSAWNSKSEDSQADYENPVPCMQTQGADEWGDFASARFPPKPYSYAQASQSVKDAEEKLAFLEKQLVSLSTSAHREKDHGEESSQMTEPSQALQVQQKKEEQEDMVFLDELANDI